MVWYVKIYTIDDHCIFLYEITSFKAANFAPPTLPFVNPRQSSSTFCFRINFTELTCNSGQRPAQLRDVGKKKRSAASGGVHQLTLCRSHTDTRTQHQKSTAREKTEAKDCCCSKRPAKTGTGSTWSWMGSRATVSRSIDRSLSSSSVTFESWRETEDWHGHEFRLGPFATLDNVALAPPSSWSASGRTVSF